MFEVEENGDRVKAYQVTLPINGKIITLEGDTGAADIVMSKTFATMKNHPPLQMSKTRLHTYTRNILDP